MQGKGVGDSGRRGRLLSPRERRVGARCIDDTYMILLVTQSGDW